MVLTTKKNQVEQNKRQIFMGSHNQNQVMLEKPFGHPNKQNKNQIYIQMATIHHDSGEYREAIKYYRAAFASGAHMYPLLVNLGNAFLMNEDYHQAIKVSLELLKHYPHCPEAYNNLGHAYQKTGFLGKASIALRSAVKYAPLNVEILNNYGVSVQLMGEVESAIKIFQKCIQIEPSSYLPQRNLKSAVLNSPNWSLDSIFAISTKYPHLHRSSKTPKNPFTKHDFRWERKIKVGILSSDLYEHPVAYNLLPLLKNYDRSKFELNLYSITEKKDHITTKIKELPDKWIEVKNFDNSKIANTIRKHNIDIMIYMAGRFNKNRPEIALLRPAPLQISFHDCATSGISSIDYFLTDSYLHPKDTKEKFTETLYHLPVFYQYSLPNHFPNVSSSPFSHNQYITFGSFNKPEKISSEVVELWSALLLKVPNSRLLLKYRSFYNDPIMIKNWVSRFSKWGIDPYRIILIGDDSTQSDHLAFYSQMDIALDTFPFNGSTTTFEALLMGVPVISLEGISFVSRVSSSILKQAGLEEFSAIGTEDYINRAINTSKRIIEKKIIRQEIRDLFLSSVLCDNKSYCKELEYNLDKLWQKQCNYYGAS